MEYHHYLFIFIKNIDSGMSITEVKGYYKNKKITLHRINQARLAAGKSAVLLSFNYCGYMTQDEYKNSEED